MNREHVNLDTETHEDAASAEMVDGDLTQETRRAEVCQQIASAACEECVARFDCPILKLKQTVIEEKLQPKPEDETNYLEELVSEEGNLVIAGYQSTPAITQGEKEPSNSIRRAKKTAPINKIATERRDVVQMQPDIARIVDVEPDGDQPAEKSETLSPTTPSKQHVSPPETSTVDVEEQSLSFKEISLNIKTDEPQQDVDRVAEVTEAATSGGREPDKDVYGYADTGAETVSPETDIVDMGEAFGDEESIRVIATKQDSETTNIAPPEIEIADVTIKEGYLVLKDIVAPEVGSQDSETIDTEVVNSEAECLKLPDDDHHDHHDNHDDQSEVRFSNEQYEECYEPEYVEATVPPEEIEWTRFLESDLTDERSNQPITFESAVDQSDIEWEQEFIEEEAKTLVAIETSLSENTIDDLSVMVEDRLVDEVLVETLQLEAVEEDNRGEPNELMVDMKNPDTFVVSAEVERTDDITYMAESQASELCQTVETDDDLRVTIKQPLQEDDISPEKTHTSAIDQPESESPNPSYGLMYTIQLLIGVLAVRATRQNVVLSRA